MARLGRLTLGLYNAYDPVRFAEAHRRALARAGAVAAAFECNLVAFGFPFQDLAARGGADAAALREPRRVARWVADSTSIGAEGAHFVALAEAGRFHIEPIPSGGFPPQYGELVLATSRAARGEAVPARALAARLAAGRSLLLLLGLGPHGFPRRLARPGVLQYDITGRGVSLETCTALGAAPAQILAHLEHVAAAGAAAATGMRGGEAA